MNEPIIYNGYNLLDEIDGWFTTATNPYKFPSKTLNTYELPNSSNTATTTGYSNGRDINIEGVVRVNGRGALDSAISKLYAITRTNNVTLEMNIGDEPRYLYGVSVKNIIVDEVAGGFARINIELHADDPYSYAKTSTEILNVVNVTSGIKTWPVTFAGLGVQAPVITYTLDSTTFTSISLITLGDPDGNSIIVRKLWAADDVLVIDCYNQTVSVNDAEVDYDGNFPEWENGSAFVSIADGLGTRQFDLNIVCRRRYA